MSGPAFAYAQARLQNRHGQRLGETVWQHLQTIENCAVFLKQARETALAPWLHNISHDADSHTVERNLLEHFRATVAETAGWLPKEWQTAILWIARLPDLPLLQYLLGGGPVLPWMTRDPVIAPLLLHLAAPTSEPPVAWQPLLRAKERQRPLIEVWLDHWRRLWPTPQPNAERLIRRIRSALDQLRLESDPDQAREIRQQLQQAILLDFRRYPIQPTTALLHLAIIGLDLARLRGVLAKRLLVGCNKEIP